jgi:Holliday junction resolvase RusA-like endonuclease
MTVKFCVLGVPQAKQRPRASMINGHARMYTPKETVNYENLVRYAYQSEVGKKLEGAIEMIVKAYFPIPKSVSKKQHALMASEEYPCTKIKDIDNVCKVCMDSILKVAYDDDRQVYRLVGEKWYSDNPRVEIELRERDE